MEKGYREKDIDFEKVGFDIRSKSIGRRLFNKGRSPPFGCVFTRGRTTWFPWRVGRPNTRTQYEGVENRYRVWICLYTRVRGFEFSRDCAPHHRPLLVYSSATFEIPAPVLTPRCLHSLLSNIGRKPSWWGERTWSVEGAYRGQGLARSLCLRQVDRSGGVAIRLVYISRVAGMTADMRHCFARVERRYSGTKKKGIENKSFFR